MNFTNSISVLFNININIIKSINNLAIAGNMNSSSSNLNLVIMGLIVIIIILIVFTLFSNNK